MYTTYHLDSAQDINSDILDAIKANFKSKPIVITVEEEISIPEWQKEEVLKRKLHAQLNPESMLDFDEMMSELEKELDNEV